MQVNPTKKHQTRIKEYLFVYKCTGMVGPLTIAIEDKPLRSILV